MPMHCGVPYASIRSLARGHVIRVCWCAIPFRTENESENEN